MKKIVLIIALALISLSNALAQDMSVKSFYHDDGEKLASVDSREDFNGNKCALVIVDVDVPLMKFYGNIFGEAERHQGKYYVYMTGGSKKLKIQHPDLNPLLVKFDDYEINGVIGGETYLLNIALPKQAKNSSFAADNNDTTRPKHLSLMCIKENKPVYFTKDQWNSLKDKETYQVLGLVIIDRQEQFFIAMEDYGKFSEEDIRKYLTQLPTEAQVQAIIDDLDNIQDALEFFGGERLKNYYYMVSKYENELILGDTDLTWKFAKEINTLSSVSNVRPVSSQLDVADSHPFKMPASVSRTRDKIKEARSQKNYEEAIRICKSIAEDSFAQYYLGIMYEYGQGVDSNLAEAFKWYEKGAVQGDADCQYQLARMYNFGIGTNQNYIEAAKWYKESAAQGDVYAKTALGFLYLNGQGVAENITEAVKYLTEGAEQGNNDAQNCLGWIYETGKGVNKDMKKAFEWYGKAAENGNVNAQVNFGLLYYTGRGTDVDKTQAYEWWLKAAEQGNPVAQSNVGYLYLHGEGIEQDNAKAIEWLRKSVDAGNASGENNLGYMYLKGFGLPVNYEEALRLFKSSAEKGNSDAQFSLGDMYENGLGVPISLDNAKEWYRKSAEQGHKEATKALSRLTGNVTQTSVVSEYEPSELK